jgi:hypothetical protein
MSEVKNAVWIEDSLPEEFLCLILKCSAVNINQGSHTLAIVLLKL